MYKMIIFAGTLMSEIPVIFILGVLAIGGVFRTEIGLNFLNVDFSKQ